MFDLVAKGRSKIEIANNLGVKRRAICHYLRVGNVCLPKGGPRYGKKSMSEEQERAREMLKLTDSTQRDHLLLPFILLSILSRISNLA